MGTTAASKAWTVVALGDSVPRGTNCHCTPYPLLTAQDLATATGHAVTGVNDSVAGYTTADVLKQLNSNAKVIGDVEHATAVEIEVGANDVGYTNSCGPEPACYAPEVPTLDKNLQKIVARVHELTSGHKVLLVLLDYWSVWLGGSYAAAQGDAYVAAAADMTDQVNTLIKTIAHDTKSTYVDLRAAFKGPNYAYDETHYLSNDGDHPNAAGHKQIALAAETAIKTRLHL
jgi:acyl-CoA thioesterase-1